MHNKISVLWSLGNDRLKEKPGEKQKMSLHERGYKSMKKILSIFVILTLFAFPVMSALSYSDETACVNAGYVWENSTEQNCIDIVENETNFTECVEIVIAGECIESSVDFLSSSLVEASLVSGQDPIVVPGEVIVEDISIEEIEPSSTLGGLVSSLSFYVEQYIDFVGLKVWKDFSTTSPEFELLAFPTGQNPDFGQLVYGDIFAESEPVILENRTITENIFVTSNADASWGDGADFQILKGLGEYMDSIRVMSINGQAEYILDGTTFFAPIEECVPALCPSEDQLSVFGLVYGIDYDEIRTFNNPYDPARVLILELNNNLVGFLIDKNKDGSWDFTENIAQGFSVNSWEKHALAILPENSYDIYAIF